MSFPQRTLRALRRLEPKTTPAPALHQTSVILALLLLLLPLTAACVTSTPGVDRIADDLERDLGLDLERGHGIKAGRMSLGLARSIARVAVDNDEEPEAIEGIRVLSGIKRVELRQYEHDGDLFAEQIAGSRALEERLGRRGWTTVARVAGDEELAWVLVQFKDTQRIRSAVVLGLDDLELNVIRISGRLDQVLQEALRLARQRVEREGDWDEDWDDLEEEAETAPERATADA